MCFGWCLVEDLPLATTQVANVSALGLYYKTTYAAVRAACPDCFVAISPLLWQQDGGAWQTFMAAPPYTRVLQDLHRHAIRG